MLQSILESIPLLPDLPGSGNPSDMNTILRTKRFPTGIEIKLIEGDITLSDAEAITNPANSQLMHGGGLAGLLSRKAGPSFQIESAKWVRENGPVSHESPAHTGAGDLPFRTIIHAVGPVWGSGDEERKLAAAVVGSLRLAERLKLKSLALPAISTGIYRYPVKKAARVILSSVQDFSQMEGISSMREIQIVLYGSQPAREFQQIWDENLT
jgi:O-acetyl-ADP-ribose deacetylase (regulator of RNase III)